MRFMQAPDAALPSDFPLENAAADFVKRVLRHVALLGVPGENHAFLHDVSGIALKRSSKDTYFTHNPLKANNFRY